jgi:hypothetical protein
VGFVSLVNMINKTRCNFCTLKYSGSYTHAQGQPHVSKHLCPFSDFTVSCCTFRWRSPTPSNYSPPGTLPYAPTFRLPDSKKASLQDLPLRLNVPACPNRIYLHFQSPQAPSQTFLPNVLDTVMMGFPRVKGQ